MTEEFNPSTPIYLQLVERINRQIIRNELKAGDKLPSVRDMAIQAGVNPNTIQRTYSELERMAIVETKRGQGTFVTEDMKKLANLREELKQEHIESFLRDMKEMGFTLEEMMEGIQMVLEVGKGGENNDQA